MRAEILEELFKVIEERKKNPKPGSYTCKLLATGKARDKVIEEATEFVEAAEKKGKEEIISEAADLFYHSLVLLVEKGVKLEEVMEELRRRRK
ncbi:MAG: phosphoribosyl-ATP diphosphatase [Candidatus Hadarchaeales archaeon]